MGRRKTSRSRRVPVVVTRQMSDEDFEKRQAERFAKNKPVERRPRLQQGFSENKRQVDSGLKFRAGGPVRSRRTATKTFDASNDANCSRCIAGIRTGDRVRFVNGELVHAVHRTKPIEIESEPCSTCWMVGPCDCREEA